MTLQWVKIKEAPIPDYHDLSGRFRIYKDKVGWRLQHRSFSLEPIFTTFFLKSAKERP